MLNSLEKVTFSRISLEKAVKTPLCALIFLKKQPKNAKYALCIICERPRTLRICEICEICEFSNSSQNLRNLRAFQNSAKNTSRNLRNLRALKTPRENPRENTQDGNNLRRNWFIGGCPINWRRPTLPHSHAVPSARTGLTALFGMGRGVPRGYNRHCLFEVLGIFYTHQRALTN